MSVFGADFLVCSTSTRAHKLCLKSVMIDDHLTFTVQWPQLLRFVVIPSITSGGFTASCTGPCDSSSLLAGLPLCIFKSLQMIQSAAAHLLSNKPEIAPVTLLIWLHWLPGAAPIKFKPLLAFKTVTRSIKWIGIGGMNYPTDPQSPLLLSRDFQRLNCPGNI